MNGTVSGVNRRRGEVAARFDGVEYRLCLTLGALAELEDAFAADDLGQLVERFSGGAAVGARHDEDHSGGIAWWRASGER